MPGLAGAPLGGRPHLLIKKGDCQCGSAPSVLEKRGSDPISENGKSRRSAQRAIDVALGRDTSIALLLVEREDRLIRLSVRVASA